MTMARLWHDYGTIRDSITQRIPRGKEISSEHPKDISAALAHLVQEEMLIKEGETRWIRTPLI